MSTQVATPGHQPSLAVLASGTGTILEAILRTKLPVAVIVADRPCRALELAAAAQVPGVLLDRRDFGFKDTKTTWDREGFTAALTAVIRNHDVELVAMSGFMTILTGPIFAAFPNRILNTHPSLLPAFKGAHAVADALAAGATETGCTVHLATPDLDAGPILAQTRTAILPGDTPAKLQERIKVIERRLYPEVIRQQLSELTQG